MNALKLSAKVGKNGRLRLPLLPLREGDEVELIILHPQVEAADLMRAAETSLSFWSNDIDDEAWNDA